MELIAGGSSRIGRAVAAVLQRAGRPFAATSRHSGPWRLDLGDEPAQWRLPGCGAAVICAAMTRLSDCEENAEVARRVNVDGPAALARKLHEQGAYVLLLSTNLVFDGERDFPMRDDAVRPTTAYGRLKAEAERAVAAATEGRGGILRLTKVLGPGDDRLLSWAGEFRRGRPVEAFSDLPLAPVGLVPVAELISRMLAQRTRGVFHCSAASDVSWSSVAERVARRCGADVRLVRPVAAGQRGVAAPRHSALGMGPAEAAIGLVPGDPWRAVEEALD